MNACICRAVSLHVGLLQCWHIDGSVVDDQDGSNTAVVLSMCCIVDSSASSWTPWSRTAVDDWIVLEPIWNVHWSDFSYRAARDPNQITSVLSELRIQLHRRRNAHNSALSSLSSTLIVLGDTSWNAGWPCVSSRIAARAWHTLVTSAPTFASFRASMKT